MKQSKLGKKRPKKIKGEDLRFLQAIRHLPCILCGSPPPTTCSHIKTRGSGGKDDYFNVLPMCLECHRFWEDNRYKVMMRKPYFLRHLKELGWEIAFNKGKLHMTHPELRESLDHGT